MLQYEWDDKRDVRCLLNLVRHWAIKYCVGASAFYMTSIVLFSNKHRGKGCSWTQYWVCIYSGFCQSAEGSMNQNLSSHFRQKEIITANLCQTHWRLMSFHNLCLCFPFVIMSIRCYNELYNCDLALHMMFYKCLIKKWLWHALKAHSSSDRRRTRPLCPSLVMTLIPPC